MIYELIDGNYTYSNNKKLLQINNIHLFLSTKSYWAQNITLDKVEQNQRNKSKTDN